MHLRRVRRCCWLERSSSCKVDVTDGGVQRTQDMHTDIPRKGELLSVAVNAHGNFMGTLFDPLGTAFNRSDFLGRADSSALRTTRDHPLRARALGRSGAVPAFDVSRVFFMIVSPPFLRLASPRTSRTTGSPPRPSSSHSKDALIGAVTGRARSPRLHGSGVGRTPKQAQAPAQDAAE